MGIQGGWEGEELSCQGQGKGRMTLGGARKGPTPARPWGGTEEGVECRPSEGRPLGGDADAWRCKTSLQGQDLEAGSVGVLGGRRELRPPRWAFGRPDGEQHHKGKHRGRADSGGG